MVSHVQSFTAEQLLQAEEITGIISCSDGDVVVLLAALADRCRGQMGVYLKASAQYRPQMIARDVATLSHLVPLSQVVVDSEPIAEVVRALLSEEEVTFSNSEATLTRAYNRPAPPQLITVSVADLLPTTPVALKCVRE